MRKRNWKEVAAEMLVRDDDGVAIIEAGLEPTAAIVTTSVFMLGWVVGVVCLFMTRMSLRSGDSARLAGMRSFGKWTAWRGQEGET